MKSLIDFLYEEVVDLQRHRDYLDTKDAVAPEKYNPINEKAYNSICQTPEDEGEWRHTLADTPTDHIVSIYRQGADREGDGAWGFRGEIAGQHSYNGKQYFSHIILPSDDGTGGHSKDGNGKAAYDTRIITVKAGVQNPHLPHTVRKKMIQAAKDFLTHYDINQR